VAGLDSTGAVYWIGGLIEDRLSPQSRRFDFALGKLNASPSDEVTAVSLTAAVNIIVCKPKAPGELQAGLDTKAQLSSLSLVIACVSSAQPLPTPSFSYTSRRSNQKAEYWRIAPTKPTLPSR